MVQLDEIQQVITPVLQANQVELYELKWRNEGRQRILECSIMYADGTMELDTCAKVSEEIGVELDKLDLGEEYFLEVCSPGAERVIRDTDELAHSVNQYIHVELHHDIQGHHIFEGELKSVTDGQVTLSVKDKTRIKEVCFGVDEIRFMRNAVKF